jgi:hypothetical protein
MDVFSQIDLKIILTIILMIYNTLPTPDESQISGQYLIFNTINTI